MALGEMRIEGTNGAGVNLGRARSAFRNFASEHAGSRAQGRVPIVDPIRGLMRLLRGPSDNR